jgi:DNA-binding transcriptional MocR family regulator
VRDEFIEFAKRAEQRITQIATASYGHLLEKFSQDRHEAPFAELTDLLKEEIRFKVDRSGVRTFTQPSFARLHAAPRESITKAQDRSDAREGVHGDGKARRSLEMNRDDRVTLLPESLRAEASKAKEEQDQAAQIAWVTALVTAKLAEKKAETSEPMSCLHCGEPLPESWRPSEITSDSDSNDDPDNGDDDDDRELDAKGKSRVVAELLRNHKRRR